MKKLALTLLALAAVTLTGAYAGSGKTFKQNVVVEEETPLFRDTEFQIDGFYHQFFAKPKNAESRTIRNGAGGGFGFNFIFARYFGIGVENFWTANNSRAPYHVNGFGILRYPIESLHLAPYALVGGGLGLGRSSYGYFNVGGGLEVRITPHFGVFADSRWYVGDPANGSDLRAGLRYSF